MKKIIWRGGQEAKDVCSHLRTPQIFPLNYFNFLGSISCEEMTRRSFFPEPAVILAVDLGFNWIELNP